MADSFLQTLLKMGLDFLSNKMDSKNEIGVMLPIGMEVANSGEIDWINPASMVSKHFSVKEAITLHAWNRLATAEDGLDDSVKAEIVKLCGIMDQVRELLGCSMNVHCIFRSIKYNEEILHSLPKDVHSMGKAIDWDVNSQFTIEQAKEKIRPVLEKLGLRLESGTSTWIHNDTHALGPSGREFKA